MFNPITISQYFVYKYGKNNDLTPMKLVKLVYLSHGWYLGATNAPLIDENPEAWQYGPVIPSVYHHYKSYGKQPVRSVFNNYNPCEELPQDIQGFLDKVWETYKNYSALDLSAMTHQVGTPWFITWHKLTQNKNELGLGIYSKQIHDNLIRDHYKAKLNSSNQVTEPIN